MGNVSRGPWQGINLSPSTLPLETGGGGGDSGGMNERVAKLEALIPTLATKADIGEVRGDLHKMDASIVRWMIATIVGLFLGFAGLFFTVSNLMKPSSSTVTPVSAQPIIIQVPAAPSSEARELPGHRPASSQIQPAQGEKPPK